MNLYHSLIQTLKKRHFLLLQGVCSPFFSELGSRLQAAGHHVHKVNFNVGDIVYSDNLISSRFRQPFAQLQHFLTTLYINHGITDQIVFGDRRPIHVEAITLARKYGIKNHVFEEGYFRPYWITLEQEGVNGRSSLPQFADWYLKAAKILDMKSHMFQYREFKSPFWRRAWHDVRYHAAGLANSIMFPAYETHSTVIAPIEYAGYVKRFTKIYVLKNIEAHWIKDLITANHKYFLLPLQLNSDAQVRDHQTLNTMPKLIEHVMTSFARFAPKDTMLVIKNHPLDYGWTSYSSLIKEFADQFDLNDRVKFLETGDLNLLIPNSLGVVTLNSTVGMIALEQDCPTISLGQAVYNFEGLTNQSGLDDFWLNRQLSDPNLFQAFKAVVLQTTQVNGGFYSPSGIELAVQGCSQALTAELSPLDQLKREVEIHS